MKQWNVKLSLCYLSLQFPPLISLTPSSPHVSGVWVGGGIPLQQMDWLQDRERVRQSKKNKESARQKQTVINKTVFVSTRLWFSICPCVISKGLNISASRRPQSHRATEAGRAYLWIFSRAGQTKQQQGVVSARRTQKETALQLQQSFRFRWLLLCLECVTLGKLCISFEFDAFWLMKKQIFCLRDRK